MSFDPNMRPSAPSYAPRNPAGRPPSMVTTSGLAIASLILGITSFIPTCLGPIVGVILGIVALVNISGSKGRIKGKGLAIGGIVLSVLFGLVTPVLLILPAVYQVREVARQQNDLNSIRLLALASAEYESRNQEFPPSNGSDAERGAGLSWRVHILPNLNERPLYEQFNLDEPWDSPTNIALLPLMPDVFKSVGVPEILPEGHTLFQRPMGNGAFDPGDGSSRKYSSIRDGSSNTIMILEVDVSESIPWTQPDDYHFDPANPMRGLGNTKAAGILAGFADGSVTTIAPSLDPETFKNIIMANDGNVIDSFRN